MILFSLKHDAVVFWKRSRRCNGGPDLGSRFFEYPAHLRAQTLICILVFDILHFRALVVGEEDTIHHYFLFTILLDSKMKFKSVLFLVVAKVNGFAPPVQISFSTASLSAYKVFIDGEAGTTGLQVRERLESREDLEIISPPSDLRKDEETRKKFINEADAVILCKST